MERVGLHDPRIRSILLLLSLRPGWAFCLVSDSAIGCIEQSSFSDKLIEQAPFSDELCGSAEFSNLAAVEHNDPVRIQNSVDAMGDGDDRAAREAAAPEICLQSSVSLHIDGRGCFVQDEDIAWRQERAGKGDQLSLSLAEIGPCYVFNGQFPCPRQPPR